MENSSIPVEEALLAWISTLPTYLSEGEIATIADFNTSGILVKLLQDIDSHYFQKSITATGKDFSIRFIIRHMEKYLKSKNDVICHFESKPEHQEITDINQSGKSNKMDKQLIEKSLKLLLCCAIVSPVSDIVRTNIIQLDGQKSNIITKLIKDLLGNNQMQTKCSNLNKNDSKGKEVENKLPNTHKLENKLLRNEMLKVNTRNSSLQRTVFLLRQEKHGGKAKKQLKAEVAELEKRLNIEAQEVAKYENINRELDNQVKKLTSQIKTKGKMEETLKQQNSKLIIDMNLIREKSKTLPTEKEMKELQQLHLSQTHANQELKKSISKNQELNAKLHTDNQKLAQELEMQRKNLNEQLEEETRINEDLIKKFADVQEGFADSTEKIEILTETKLALIQMLIDATQDKKTSSDFTAKLEAIIQKLGWENLNTRRVQN